MREFFFDHLYDTIRGLSTEINAVKVIGPTQVGKLRSIGVPGTSDLNYAMIMNEEGKYGFYEFENNEKGRKFIKSVVD